MKQAFTIFLMIAQSMCAIQLTAQGQTVSKLKFINEFVVPFNQDFKGTTIGGLSGIDYDNGRDIFYVLSDDRSDINPVRFYTTKIALSKKGIDSVIFTDVHSLLQHNGKNYPSFKLHPEESVDPEDIRFNSKTNELYWVSEGERILNRNQPILINTSIETARLDGSFINSFPLPKILAMSATENGPRRNGALESISFNKDFSKLFTALEEPVYQDGPRADIEKTDSWARLFQFDQGSKQNTAQYAYALEPIAFPATPATAFKINGISCILTLDDNHLLVIERSFSSGRQPCTIKVFLTDLTSAENIKDNNSLTQHPPKYPALKKLILNMDDLGIYIDNVEGITFGPTLANGHQSLIFVTDDNFQEKQKNQFLLFEVIP